MKRSDNTEMDRLLRRHARLSGDALRAPYDASESASTSGAHLDADELNAYAEGALNEAARSRYFAHLADCDTCRKLVTDLTLAASVSIEGKARAAVAEASPSRSWRDWLGAIFSPPVLRYGVPALVLFAVIIVAFVATRTNRESGSSVAQRSKETSNYAPADASNSNSVADSTTTTGTVESHSNINAATLEEQKSGAPLTASATPPPANSPAMDEDTRPATQAGAPKPAPAQADDAKTRAGEFSIAGKREQEQVAAAPPASPPTVLSAPAATGADARTIREEEGKNKVAEKDEQEVADSAGNTAGGVVASQTEASRQRRDVGRAAASRAAKSLPSNRPATVSKSGPADANTKEDKSTETLSVGGRRFRKQGVAWVDTAYNSSSPTTNVARGSEHYRTLIADEPALRTITRQLGGEVIVVWKNRAYRFY